MFNVVTQKVGKTAKGEEEKIKAKIVAAQDRGICDSDGRTIEKNGQLGAGKGSRNRNRRVQDIDALCARATRNLWPRDADGNLKGDN